MALPFPTKSPCPATPEQRDKGHQVCFFDPLRFLCRLPAPPSLCNSHAMDCLLCLSASKPIWKQPFFCRFLPLARANGNYPKPLLLVQGAIHFLSTRVLPARTGSAGGTLGRVGKVGVVPESAIPSFPVAARPVNECGGEARLAGKPLSSVLQSL